MSNKIKEVKQLHEEVIQEYFNNGYNKSKAVMEVMKIKSQGTAGNVFNTIYRKKENQQYIQEQKARLNASTDITSQQVIRELMNWSFNDATEYIGLTIEQFKELTPEQRRCIQSFKSVTKTETNRKGEPTKTTTIEVKLMDKQKALDSISKHIGLFELDNQSKRNVNINVSNIATEDLKTLLKVKKKMQTIDVTNK